MGALGLGALPAQIPTPQETQSSIDLQFKGVIYAMLLNIERVALSDRSRRACRAKTSEWVKGNATHRALAAPEVGQLQQRGRVHPTRKRK